MTRGREVPLREAARGVAEKLIGAGYEAYFAGGCVRDVLLGREPTDFDIATSATPEQIVAVFPRARGVGESFGVMLVREWGHTFEVATFREDGPYHDGRRPSEIHFSTAERDAQRRDFTVNGMFEHPLTGEPVDFVDGRADIAAKLIRAIGDPHARIHEDRLRMLRAVRFAARLGFAIEPATSAAVREHATELRAVSPERVGDEVRKMLEHPARLRATTLVEEHQLDRAVFGGESSIGGLPRVAALPHPSGAATVLAAWWLDRLARDAARDDRSAPRPDASARSSAISGLRTRLVLTNHETDALRNALDVREALLAGFDGLGHAARVRCIARPGFDAALDVLMGERPADAARWRAVADRELPTRSLPEPLLDGNALVAEGMRPGPRFKVLLDLAMDAQIEGRIASLADALQLVRAADRTG